MWDWSGGYEAKIQADTSIAFKLVNEEIVRRLAGMP